MNALREADDGEYLGFSSLCPVASIRSRRSVMVFSQLVVFLSGAAALVYEISWSRQIGLLFGHTAQAAAIVLSGYFAGMALGYLLGARLATRVSPLVGYAAAELTAAGWACSIPALLHLSESTTISGFLNSSSLLLQTTSRAAFCFSLLLPATIALGATLPMMADFFFLQQCRATGVVGTESVSLAYAINLAGALFGVVAATFFLLPIVGVCTSSYVAAVLSTACGLAACVLRLVDRRLNVTGKLSGDIQSIRVPGRRTVQSPGSSRGKLVACEVAIDCRSKSERKWFTVAALSGFGTMSLEVLYTRLFSLVFHNSTYTFGAVVAVFLAALALGAAIVARLRRNCSVDHLAGHAAGLGAFLTMLSLMVFVQLTDLDYVASGRSFVGYMSVVLLLVGLVIAPPVTCMGMLLPLTWKAIGGNMGVGRIVGQLTAANTICSALGALTAGFLVLPWLGLWQSFTLVSTLFFAVSFVLLWGVGHRRVAASGGVTFAVLTAVALYNLLVSEDSRNHSEEQFVRRWQSAYGWIDVVQNRKTGSFKVRQNLHYRFGETGTGVRESRQSHIPLLLHGRPRDVFVMGLGTGLTAGGVIAHEDVERLVVVELIPEVVEAARLLADHNYGVVGNPKVEVFVDDARHFLLACGRRFDVIISDMFVPWESETGYLYTVEHYRVARQRLKPDGLFCQWIPLYQLGEREFELIADSFASVFPVTTIWWGKMDPAQPIIALVGTESSLEADSGRLTMQLARLEQRLRSRDEYLNTPQTVHSLYLGDWAPHHVNYLNTDEHPRVEFLTPMSHRDQRLLYGPTLLKYFDKVLARLPSGSAHFCYHSGQLPPEPAQVRAGHRFIIFGQ